MGQGLYSAILFGVTDDAWVPVGDEYGEPVMWYMELESRLEKEYGVRFDNAYESEDRFRGVIVAVSDPCVVWKHPIPELPDRFAVPLDGLAARLSGVLVPADIERAKVAWEMLRAGCRDHGVEVPEGGLIYVSDYD
jgi:hypothetical protein